MSTLYNVSYIYIRNTYKEICDKVVVLRCSLLNAELRMTLVGILTSLLTICRRKLMS